MSDTRNNVSAPFPERAIRVVASTKGLSFRVSGADVACREGRPQRLGRDDQRPMHGRGHLTATLMAQRFSSGNGNPALDHWFNHHRLFDLRWTSPGH